jgi:hypothetical protein
MDLILFQIRMAYRQNPGFTVFFLALSALAGFGIGFRFLGPLLFG